MPPPLAKLYFNVYRILGKIHICIHATSNFLWFHNALRIRTRNSDLWEEDTITVDPVSSGRKLAIWSLWVSAAFCFKYAVDVPQPTQQSSPVCGPFWKCNHDGSQRHHRIKTGPQHLINSQEFSFRKGIVLGVAITRCYCLLICSAVSDCLLGV